MNATGTSDSGSVWFPARRQSPADDAPSRARSRASCGRCDRDKTRETPPRSDIYIIVEKARGGAFLLDLGYCRIVKECLGRVA